MTSLTTIDGDGRSSSEIDAGPFGADMSRQAAANIAPISATIVACRRLTRVSPPGARPTLGTRPTRDRPASEARRAGLRRTRRPPQSDRGTDHIEYQAARELFPHVGGHAFRSGVSGLDHGEQHAGERERRGWCRAMRECRAVSAPSSAARAARTGAEPALAGCRQYAVHDRAESGRRVDDDRVAALPCALKQLARARRIREEC